MKISLLMTAYQRSTQLNRTLDSVSIQTRIPDQIVVVEDGSDGGATESVCKWWIEKGLPIEYYCRKNRPALGFSNPAIPKNIGIQKSTGEILILQCAEVMYKTPRDIHTLIVPVEENLNTSHFAICERIDSDGRNIGVEYPKLFVEYCQAISREAVMAIGGYQECFKGYAFEDCDFQNRLQRHGIEFCRAENVIVYHQHHDRVMNDDKIYWSDMQVSKQRSADIVANVGRTWGDLNA